MTNLLNSLASGITGNNISIPTTNPQLSTKEMKDTDWIRQALFIPQRSGGNAAGKTDSNKPGREWTASSFYFSDTTLGGNKSINPKPQFCDITDPIKPSVLVKLTNSSNPSDTMSTGMGRYYAETIESNARRIYMQFGLPGFNSLTNFFTTFYDRKQGQLMNSGSVNNFFHTAGKWVGYITLFPVAFVLGTSSFISKAVASLQNRPLSKFYYVKPNMFLYWSAVQNIVNALAVNMRLITGIDQDENNMTDSTSVSKENASSGLSKADVQTLNRLLPDIFKNDNGGIDIYNVATRYQRLQLAHNQAIADIIDGETEPAAINAKMQAFMAAPFVISKMPKTKPWGDWVKDYLNSAFGLGVGDQDSQGTMSNNVPSNGTPTPNQPQNANSESSGMSTGLSEFFGKFQDYAKAELTQGSAYVCFTVEHEQTVGESFSSSTKQSDIASTMNETSRSARSKLFNFAGGNIGDNPIANMAESAFSAIGSLAGGFLESVKLQGIAALGGKAFVDIPDIWEDSETSWTTANYTIKLRSPYGNPISLFMNILVPLAMLLAGACPRSTGRNSWTGPFLCKLWDQGRNQIDIGIIDSLSITRGAGNNGWNLLSQATGIDVTIGIRNLSKVLHMPVVSEVSLEERIEQGLGISGIFDEPSNFTNYMAVLSGLGLTEQTFFKSKMVLARAKALENFDSRMSASGWASYFLADNPAITSFLAYRARQSVD